MAGVAGQWEATLSIDGKDIPVNPTLVKEITVREGLHRSLPTCTVKVIDRLADLVTSAGVKDGKPMRIMLSDGTQDGNKFAANFRILGGPQATYTGQGTHLQLNGVLDAMPWMRKISSSHLRGTSSEMLAKLAREAGLRTQIDPTNDRQVWLPNRKPLVNYAQKVAQHGWASATSCMMMCVDSRGVLQYRNVENIIKGALGLKFGAIAGGIPVTQIQISDKSGAYNQSGAYGSTSLGEGLQGALYEFTKTTGIRLSNFTNFSDFMQTAVGAIGGRVSFNPIDSGNTHKKYHEAKHQNTRIKSTFSFDCHILTNVASKALTLDLAQLEAVNPLTGHPMPFYSGKYIVSNIMRTFQGVGQGRYYEKLTLTSQGPNA